MLTGQMQSLRDNYDRARQSTTTMAGTAPTLVFEGATGGGDDYDEEDGHTNDDDCEVVFWVSKFNNLML